MRNIKMTVSYEGTAYCGWQIQNKESSIQATIQDRYYELFKEKIHLIGSGRTDAGVHSLNQIVNFKTSILLEPHRIQRALNAKLPKDIRIKNVCTAPLNFHARYDAIGKTYLYIINIGEVDNLILSRFSTKITYPLNIQGIDQGIKYFLGEHDFSAFTSKGSDPGSYVRNIIDFRVLEQNNLMAFVVTGNGFLYKMVRTMVGTLIEVGRSKISPKDIPIIIESKERKNAGPTANPEGLILAQVYYELDEMDDFLKQLKNKKILDLLS